MSDDGPRALRSALRRGALGTLLVLTLGGCSAKPARSPSAPAADPLLQLEVPGPQSQSKDPSCLRNQGGCGETPGFPRCPPDLRVVPLATMLENPSAYAYRAPRYETVAIAGNLLRKYDGQGCTVAGCAPGACCNQCSAELTLQDPRIPGVAVELEQREGGGLQCNGDESLICCPPPQQRYVVRGALSVGEDCPRGVPCRPVLAMVDAEVCSP